LEETYVDEVMRCLQSTSAQGSIVRFGTLSMRMDLVGRLLKLMSAAPELESALIPD
jgi:hypothetical protein